MNEHEPTATADPITDSSSAGTLSLWALLTAFVGIALWAQLLLVPLLAEFRYTDGRMAALGFYLIPVAILGLGIALKRSALLLMLFPVSLLPALAWLPEPDWAALHQGTTMIWLVSTLTAYFVVCSWRSPGWRPGSGNGGRPLDDDSDLAGVPLGVDYRGFFFSRLGASLFVLLTILYGIYFDREVGELFRLHHGEAEVVAMSFTTMVMFFAWCVFVYMMIIVPGANLEYDRRRLERELRQWTKQWEVRRQVVRVSGWAVASLVVAIAATLWF
jgi:hypothetical protein